jgi:hypothetical protein
LESKAKKCCKKEFSRCTYCGRLVYCNKVDKNQEKEYSDICKKNQEPTICLTAQKDAVEALFAQHAMDITMLESQIGKNPKIVFLDIDGVICLYPEWQQSWIGNENSLLDQCSCGHLKEILELTGAQIVITSSWRLEGDSLKRLSDQFAQFDIKKDCVIGQTEDFSLEYKGKSHNELRWLEIKDFIGKYRITFDNCVPVPKKCLKWAF